MVLRNPFGRWLKISLLKSLVGSEILSLISFLATVVDLNVFSVLMSSVFVHIIVATRLVSAQNWKSPYVPSEGMVLPKYSDCSKMDKLTLILNDGPDDMFISK